VILSYGGDGVPFPFYSVMGNLSCFIDCGSLGLAVFTIHIAASAVFFIVFHLIDCTGFYRGF
jgi:hypothetical protein